jgi:hypothetical protein
MDSKYIDFLVWLASKLSDASNAVFVHAVNLSKNTEEKNPTVAVAQPKPVERPVEYKPEPADPDEARSLTFVSGSGKPIPMSFEALPEEIVFRLMFERKYGKNGLCPITVSGQTRPFTCEGLYELLKQIHNTEDPSPIFRGVYGSVMSMIMHAHGEDLDPDLLN